MQWSDGNGDAFDELLPLVYKELHKQAARFLKSEHRAETLQTTALIHETYLKLINQTGIRWESRMQFFAFAAKVMRHILVDHARTKHREKRGGNVAVKVSLNEATMILDDERNIDLIALDKALNRLAKIDKAKVSVVELRFFSGLSLEETAEVLKISRAKAARDWAMAKAWLHRELTR